MLISLSTTINVNSYNYKKLIKEYGDKLDIKIDEKLEIPVELLPNGSGHKVDVKCNYCNITYQTEWRKYINIKEQKSKTCCGSKKCLSEKKRETNIKKWGVDNPMKNNKVKEKFKKSIKNKFGVEHYSKTDEYKEKIKNNSLNKWGVDHYSKTDEYKEKFKNTILNKYGVNNPFQSEEIKNKIKQENLEKYGVDNYSKTDECKEKVINTGLDKWGVGFYSKTDECKEKVKKRNLDKWGVDNYNKTNISKIGTKIGSDLDYIEYNGDLLHKFKCEQDHFFDIKNDNYLKRKDNNIPLCTVCNPISDLKSIKEKELLKYIKSIYNDEIIDGYRDVYEIDIYLPELKIGFEFNGLYYHSDKFKEKNYHLDKTNYFKERGIQIIHIWEDDWILKNKIIKSQIKNWLGFSKKIWARKCEIREIKNSKIVTKFLDDNHIQGKVNSNLKLGLYYKNELVSIMTFNHFEGRKKMNYDEWNINRFCNKLDYNVIGGASKLISYFVKNKDVSRIISYADKDWSVGGLYYKLGFFKLYETKPDYKYIVNNKRTHKSNFKKSITNISESKLNLLKVWNCGKIKFEKKYN